VSDRVAVVGCGLVGSGWAIVFARAGYQVALYDSESGVADAARERIAGNLAELSRHNLIADPDATLAHVVVSNGLADALADAAYVQESVFESVAIKKAVFAEIDAVLGPTAVVGSSSSGIPASSFTADVACRQRCLVAHPVNPPYLVPVVELVPAPWTDPASLKAVHRLMQHVGQVPVLLAREIEGFILNRLQGALLSEAWHLVGEGYATVEDVDLTVSHGLGLRWSFMGPFETIDLNAPGGVADYARRLGPLYERIATSDAPPQAWSDELIAEVERQRRILLPRRRLTERTQWRDRRLMTLATQRRENEHSDSSEREISAATEG